MVKRPYLLLINFFLFLLLFIAFNNFNSQPVFAQTCVDMPTVSSLPSCSQPLFDSNCEGSGIFTGTACCQNLGYASCQNYTIDPLPQQHFRCCYNAPTPTPTPTPAPTCVQTPGSLAGYFCSACNYATAYYYNCDGSIFTVGEVNASCNYPDICGTTPPAIPNCDSGISCSNSCTATSSNTCSNNGVRSGCVYTSYSGGACSQTTAPNQACSINNCSTGYSCSGGSCIPNQTCGNSSCDAGEDCNSCSRDCGACPTTPPAPTPSPTDYCSAAGYYPCNPGTAVGSCTLNGQTCTAWSVYQCNFGGQEYCGSTCDQPCDTNACNYNNAQDNGETGIDCGGGNCPACQGGGGGKYKCSGSSCIPAADGWTTDSSCGGACNLPAGIADWTCRQYVSTNDTDWPPDSSNPPENWQHRDSISVRGGDRVYFKVKLVNQKGDVSNSNDLYVRNYFNSPANGNLAQNANIYPSGNGYPPNPPGDFGSSDPWYSRDQLNNLRDVIPMGGINFNAGMQGLYQDYHWDNPYTGAAVTGYWSEVLNSNASTFTNQAWAVAGAYTNPGSFGGNFNDRCWQDPVSGGPTCLRIIPAGDGGRCNQAWSVCQYDVTFNCNTVTVKTTLPISGYVRDIKTGNGIAGVEVQVYDDTNGQQTQTASTDAGGHWVIDNFVRPGDFYAVRVTGNLASPRTAPIGYTPPAKTSTAGWTWNYVVNPNSDVPPGSASYEGQLAGNNDCAGSNGSGVTGRCNFTYDLMPVAGYVKDSQTNAAIGNVQVQVYDDTFNQQTKIGTTDTNGYWHVDNFVRPGDWYAVRITVQVPGYILPAKTSTVGWTWNFNINPIPGTSPGADTAVGSPAYEGQIAGSGVDCAGPDGSTPPITGRCSFTLDRDGDPKGYLDTANCTSFVGWSCDPDDYNSQLQIDFWARNALGNDTYVGWATANGMREAAVAALCGGNANHGFIFPPSGGVLPGFLKTGQNYQIYAYGLNTIGTGNTTTLIGSPKIINCSAGSSCNNNGTCDAGETCSNCPGDCTCSGNTNPWIQTVNGDVHSNTRINTPGGP